MVEPAVSERVGVSGLREGAGWMPCFKPYARSVESISRSCGSGAAVAPGGFRINFDTSGDTKVKPPADEP